MVDRRSFLACFSSLGLTSTLLPGVLWAKLAAEKTVVVTKEMLSRSGVGPSGVAWDELIADIKALPANRAAGDPAGDPLTTLA